MAQTSLFKNNRTQSVRLPKGVAFPDSVHEVEIAVMGESRVVTPRGMLWDHWFEYGGRVSDDFLESREQPDVDERAW